MGMLLNGIMRDCVLFTGKQLAYLSLETPGGALKAAAEQEDLGKHLLPQSASFPPIASCVYKQQMQPSYCCACVIMSNWEIFIIRSILRSALQLCLPVLA